MSMIGKTFNHYQVTSQLGKGGMGEVYQAKDQKLGRDVVIKLLSDEFSREADRIARFQREAKVLASLNHPNIAAIYGLEESGGTNFICQYEVGAGCWFLQSPQARHRFVVDLRLCRLPAHTS